MNETKSIKMARLATMGELIENVLPLFISPIPSRETLRSWFNRARIPRLKTSPTAKRGGGAMYYDVQAVEMFLQGRIINPSIPTSMSVGIPKKAQFNQQ